MSRLILKDEQLPVLYDCQQKAVKFRYPEWVSYMRDHYSYHLALSMARHMGFAKTGSGFYDAMRKAGFDRIREVREARRKGLEVPPSISELHGV